MTVPIPPPLPVDDSLCRECDGVRRDRVRGSEVLRDVAITAVHHWSASVGAHSLNIRATAYVSGAAFEVNVFAVRRPRIDSLHNFMPGESREIASRDLEDVNVSVSASGRREREAFPVGRVHRPRFRSRMRHEQSCYSAGCGDRPYVSSRYKRYLRVIRGDCRLVHRRTAVRRGV